MIVLGKPAVVDLGCVASWVRFFLCLDIVDNLADMQLGNLSAS